MYSLTLTFKVNWSFKNAYILKFANYIFFLKHQRYSLYWIKLFLTIVLFVSFGCSYLYQYANVVTIKQTIPKGLQASLMLTIYVLHIIILLSPISHGWHNIEVPIYYIMYLKFCCLQVAMADMILTCKILKIPLSTCGWHEIDRPRLRSS